jgi:hypothetical protein
MKWLLTTPDDLDVDVVRHEVEAAGGKLEPRPAVPLSGGERVLYAEGPEDFPERLQERGLPIEVSPSSELKLY